MHSVVRTDGHSSTGQAATQRCRVSLDMVLRPGFATDRASSSLRRPWHATDAEGPWQKGQKCSRNSVSVQCNLAVLLVLRRTADKTAGKSCLRINIYVNSFNCSAKRYTLPSFLEHFWQSCPGLRAHPSIRAISRLERAKACADYADWPRSLAAFYATPNTWRSSRSKASTTRECGTLTAMRTKPGHSKSRPSCQVTPTSQPRRGKSS